MGKRALEELALQSPPNNYSKGGRGRTPTAAGGGEEGIIPSAIDPEAYLCMTKQREGDAFRNWRGG